MKLQIEDNFCLIEEMLIFIKDFKIIQLVINIMQFNNLTKKNLQFFSENNMTKIIKRESDHFK